MTVWILFHQCNDHHFDDGDDGEVVALYVSEDAAVVAGEAARREAAKAGVTVWTGENTDSWESDWYVNAYEVHA